MTEKHPRAAIGVFIATLVLLPSVTAVSFVALMVVVVPKLTQGPHPQNVANQFTQGVLNLLPYTYYIYIFTAPIAALAGLMLSIWVYRGRPLNLIVCIAAAVLATLGVAAAMALFALANGGLANGLPLYTLLFAVSAAGGATICYLIGNLICNGAALVRRLRSRS